MIWYEVFSGDLLEVAESHFQYNNETYIQRIILPKHSSTFTLKFKLFAQLGLEVFLRFNQPNHSYNWFYTFNSADIMSRHPFPDETYLSGDNYFPINAGLIIESQESYLAIFPNFPLGAGMPDQSNFELHLHRNPDKSDGLGISGYYGEYSPAEHEFLIGFTELKPSMIWETYLENKAAPQVFFKGSDNSFTEDLQNAEKNTDGWNFETEYSLINEDRCGYISSIVKRQDDLICRIINICDEPIDPAFRTFELVEELNALGGEIEQRQNAIANGILEFPINDNSARNFVQYPKSYNDGLMQPFNLYTYRIQRRSL